MAERNVTEFGVNAGATYVVLLQDEDLDRLDEHLPEREGNFHLYFIGRRPRISVSVAHFQFTPTLIQGRFLVQRGMNLEPHDFECAQFEATPAVALESEWPHTSFRFNDKDGKAILEGRAALIAPLLASSLERDAAIEILYVGQSYGEQGELSAEGRLQKHATLQKILGETSRRSPDQEVWLLLAEFDAVLATSISGKLANALDADTAAEGRKIAAVTERTFSGKQFVAFVEAAFINYFQPPFNKTFRELFPHPSHSTYREYYDIDLNALTVRDRNCMSWDLAILAVSRKEFASHGIVQS